jgi:lysophospholipase L1-like esterase
MTPDSFPVYRMLRPVFWVVVFFIFIELGLEVRAHLRGWDTLLYGMVRAEEAGGTSDHGANPAFGPTAHFPFRGPVVGLLKPAGAVRIWVASASHGEDIYLPVESIFPSLIGEGLESAGISAQVLNASRAGTGISGNLAMLKRDFDDWQPDFVVLYQLSMDISILSEQLLAPIGSSVPGQRATDESGPFGEEGNQGLSWASRTFEKFTVYELLNAKITTPLSTAQVLNDDLGTEAEASFRRTVEEFVEQVRQLGAEPILCTFATSYSPRAPGPIPRDVVLFVHRWNKHLSARGWLDAIDRLNGVIRAVAQERNVHLVDLEPALTGRQEFFRDPVHFSPAGHRAMAEGIASGLSQRLPPRDVAKR